MLVIITKIGDEKEGISRYSVVADGSEVYQFEHNDNDGLIELLKTAEFEAKTAQAKEYGKRLNSIRKQAGLTLRQVGDITGKNIGYISDLEHGRRPWNDAAWFIYNKVKETHDNQAAPKN